MNLKTLSARVEALERQSGALPPYVLVVMDDGESEAEARMRALAPYMERERHRIPVVCITQADARA